MKGNAMTSQRIAALVLSVACIAVLSSTPADAYRSYRTSDEPEAGFFLFLDAALTRAGGTDQVVAENVGINSSPQVTEQIAMDWDDGLSGRLGFGYRWATGNKVTVSYWQYDDDAKLLTAQGPNDGYMNFAIGPATYYDGYPTFNFGFPGTAVFNANIKASTADVSFGRDQSLADSFRMEWNLGLRYAKFEEDVNGLYDLCATSGCWASYYGITGFGEVSFNAQKTNSSEMFGAVASARGRYFVSPNFAVTGMIGFSFLGGETESFSGLIPTGSFNSTFDPPTEMRVKDDSNTGTILDFDAGIEWYIVPDLFRLDFALYQSRWDGLPEDMTRNAPGVIPVLDPRDSMSFSGLRIGLWVRF